MTTPEGKKADEILREMRAEVEKATDRLKGAAHRAMERPETKDLLAKADRFLGALSKGATSLIHEMEKEFKELAGKLDEAAKKHGPGHGPGDDPGHQDGSGI